MKNTIKNLFAIGTLGAALFAFTAAAPARADHYIDVRNAVRHDLDRVDSDQHHLRDLNKKLDNQRYHSDYRGARHTQDAIARAQLDLQRDRDNLRIDQRELDRIGARHDDRHRW